MYQEEKFVNIRDLEHIKQVHVVTTFKKVKTTTYRELMQEHFSRVSHEYLYDPRENRIFLFKDIYQWLLENKRSWSGTVVMLEPQEYEEINIIL